MNNDFDVDRKWGTKRNLIFYSVFPFECIANGYTRPALATCDCALSTVNVKCCVYKCVLMFRSYSTNSAMVRRMFCESVNIAGISVGLPACICVPDESTVTCCAMRASEQTFCWLECEHWAMDGAVRFTLMSKWRCSSDNKYTQQLANVKMLHRLVCTV